MKIEGTGIEALDAAIERERTWPWRVWVTLDDGTAFYMDSAGHERRDAMALVADALDAGYVVTDEGLGAPIYPAHRVAFFSLVDTTGEAKARALHPRKPAPPFRSRSKDKDRR